MLRCVFKKKETQDGQKKYSKELKARKWLRHGAERAYDSTGKWIGWQNKAGDNKVYWGMGIGVKGKGHFFIEDKIESRGMWESFVNEFGL